MLSQSLASEAWTECCRERILVRMKITVRSRGRIVVPAEFRRQDDLQPGEVLNVERVKPGHYHLSRRPLGNEGLVDWLLSCPVKGYFVPIDGDP